MNLSADIIGALYNVGAFVCPKCLRMLPNKLIEGYAEKAEDLKKRGAESEAEGKYWVATCEGCQSVCHSYFDGVIEWRITPITFTIPRTSMKDVVGRGQSSVQNPIDADSDK